FRGQRIGTNGSSPANSNSANVHQLQLNSQCAKSDGASGGSRTSKAVDDQLPPYTTMVDSQGDTERCGTNAKSSANDSEGSSGGTTDSMTNSVEINGAVTVQVKFRVQTYG